MGRWCTIFFLDSEILSVVQCAQIEGSISQQVLGSSLHGDNLICANDLGVPRLSPIPAPKGSPKQHAFWGC